MTDHVYTPESPWFPPETPMEFPEGRLTPAWVGKVTKFKNFDVMIRSHLFPRHPKDTRYMAAYRTFWRAIAFADRKQVFAMLERWDGAAEAALANPALSEEEAAYVRRFRGDVNGTLNRLNRANDEPMAWAGAEFSKYAPEQRVMVEALIGAITLHRVGEFSDAQLYSILRCLDVDPADREIGITAASLEAIHKAATTGEPLDLQSTYRRS